MKLFLIVFLFIGLQVRADNPSFPDRLPSKFDANYKIDLRQATITPESAKPVPGVTFSNDTSKGMTRAYQDGEGASTWYVGTQTCEQNKQFSCLSVYERNNYKINGNQTNPFAPSTQSGRYTLYRINKSNPQNSEVIKCDSNLKDLLIKDKASLNGCVLYSKNTCEKFAAIVNKLNSTPANPEFRNVSNAIFQSDLNSRVKDISANFDEATKADAPHFKPEITIEQASLDSGAHQKEIKQAIATNEFVNRAENCSTYMTTVFASTADHQAYIKKAKREGQNSSSVPATRTLDKKTKAGN